MSRDTSSPVHQLVLHLQVVEEHGSAQLCVADGLLQRESLGEEGNQAVAHWPRLHGLIEDGVVREYDQLDVVLLAQTSQDVLHRCGECLKGGGRKGGRIVICLYTYMYIIQRSPPVSLL